MSTSLYDFFIFLCISGILVPSQVWEDWVYLLFQKHVWPAFLGEAESWLRLGKG